MFLVQKCVRISRPPGASGICPLTGARVPLTHPERPGIQCGAAIDAPARPCLMQHSRAYISIHVLQTEDDSKQCMKENTRRPPCPRAYKSTRPHGFCAAVRPGWCVGCTTRPAVHQGGKCDGNMVGGNNTTCGKMVRRHFTLLLYDGFCGLLSRFFLRVCGLPAGADQAARRLPPEMSNNIADDHIHQNDGKNAFHFLPPLACKAQNL